MLHSVITSGGADRVQVHYLHPPALDSREARRLGRMVENLGGSASFIEVPDDWCEGLPIRGFTGKATWYKIHLPDLLPTSVERVLYLDADVLVVSSLEALWRTPLEHDYLGAVTNVLPPIYRNRPRELGLPEHQPYFNAGVMLMNLRQMRRDGCAAALRSYGIAHARELVLRDQDALNVVLGERRVPLHPRWNCMNALFVYSESARLLGAENVKEARDEPAIRHFEGPNENKPWHLLCAQPERRLYNAHRRRTPWPVYVPAGLTLKNIGRWFKRRLGAALRSARLRQLRL